MLPSELIVVRYRENRAVPLELGAVPDHLELIAQDLRRRAKRNGRRTKLVAHILIKQALFECVDSGPQTLRVRF